MTGRRIGALAALLAPSLVLCLWALAMPSAGPGVPGPGEAESAASSEDRGEDRAKPSVLLADGTDAARHGAPGDIHRFAFSTSAPWIDLQLHKAGGDASLRLLLDGHELLWVDSPASRFDTEPLVWQADGDGEQAYEVEVHCRARVDFTLRLQTYDQPSGDLRRHLGALRLSAAAADAYRQDTSSWRQKSVALYRKALESWRGLDASRQQARTLFALGVLHQELGEPEAAQENLEEALRIFGQIGDLHGEASSLNRFGVLLRQLGRSEEAQDAYRNALRLNQQLDDGCGAARSQLNLGLLEQRGGRPVEAQTLYGQALEGCPPEDDPFLAAELLVDMAGTYDALGDLNQAAEGLQRAIPLLRQQGRAGFLAVALGNLGAMQRKLGNYEAALEAFHAGLEVARELGDPRRQATLLNSLGHAYLRLGEPRRAVAYLQEALPLRRQAGHRRGEAVTLSNLGQAFAELNKAEPARRHYQAGLDVRRELGDQRGIGVTLHRLAKVEQADGRIDVARGLLPAILEIGREAGDPRLEGQALLLQAELLLDSDALHEQEGVLVILQRSRQLLQKAADREFIATNWKVTAQVQQRLGDLAAAQEALESAAEHLEAIRADLHHPDLRSGFLVRQQETYRLAVDVALQRHRVEPKEGWQRHALALDERIKARGLLDRVVEAEQRRAEHVAPELAARRLLLMQQMRGLRSRLSGKRTPWHGELEQRLQQVVGELERVEGDLRQQDPSFRQLSRPKVLAPEAMQTLVEKGTLVLQFHLADPVSHLWAIDRHRVQVHDLPAKGNLDLKARQLHGRWSERALRDAGTQRRLAMVLGDVLLGPVAAQLDAYERLVFVLDGALHLLPFGALPRPSSGADRAPLIADFEVIEIPSLSVVAGLRGRRAGDRGIANLQALQPGSIVVLADPVFERRDPRWDSRSSKAVDSGRGGPAPETPMLRREALTRLPASGDEARAIAALAPDSSTLYTGFEASRQVILEGALRDAHIVHFATHGQVDTLQPRLSGLSFAAWDAQGRPLDGHLSLQEIYGLVLPETRLVVLSGCRTALGNEQPGEGLLSLTRGFLHAGASQVVASLWTVEDDAGRHLMGAFYHQLLHERVSASQALRLAQNQLRQETRWQDPYYWGAFVHQGDWR